MRNNNNKGSRSNVNKHELVYGESSTNAGNAPNVCLSFVLLFTIFIIVVTQKLVLQQSKNVTAKCTEILLPPPYIQFSLAINNLCQRLFIKAPMWRKCRLLSTWTMKSGNYVTDSLQKSRHLRFTLSITQQTTLSAHRSASKLSSLDCVYSKS